MLEYMAIAILVMMAIMFGGPVLVNSIGAHMKITDDNATDAFGEKIKPAALMICDCKPLSTNPLDWPDVGGECKGLGRLRSRECLPASCIESKLVPDSECCNDAIPGAYGEVADAKLCQRRETLDTIALKLFPGMQGRCLDNTTTGQAGVRGCLSSEVSYSATCGENFVRYACK